MRAIKLQFHAAAFVLFLSVPLLSAQKSKAPASLPAPAPVPAQIVAAQKVFIANGGGQSFDLSGGPDRAYDEFYDAMRGIGRYDLVSSPANADLVLEISWNWAPTTTLGRVRLRVIDPQTHVTLWSFIEYPLYAMQLGNRDKNFDQTMHTIVSRFQQLAGPPAQGQARD